MQKKKPPFWGIIFGISVLLTAGCAAVPGLRVNANAGDHSDVSPKYKVVELTPTVIGQLRQVDPSPIHEGLTAANPSLPPENYQIGPGDVLQVVVWDHLELTNPFGAVNRDPVNSGQLVAADGTVYFPYVGVFQAGGKTIQQVREYISTVLTNVVTKPQVDVRVVAYRSARIQVTGEVKNPGVVTLDDTTKGLLEALNERGGLNPTASRRTALLIRDGRSYPVNIANLLSGSTPDINPLLKAGDIVHIPDFNNDQVFVLGELAKQGPVTIGQQQLTLTEVLTKSGGLERVTANDSGILIFRRPTQDQDSATVYTLDLSSPQGLLLAGEFSLEPRDVVYVKATKFAQYNLVINQLLPTISTIFQIDRLTK